MQYIANLRNFVIQKKFPVKKLHPLFVFILIIGRYLLKQLHFHLIICVCFQRKKWLFNIEFEGFSSSYAQQFELW